MLPVLQVLKALKRKIYLRTLQSPIRQDQSWLPLHPYAAAGLDKSGADHYHCEVKSRDQRMGNNIFHAQDTSLTMWGAVLAQVLTNNLYRGMV